MEKMGKIQRLKQRAGGRLYLHRFVFSPEILPYDSTPALLYFKEAVRENHCQNQVITS